MALVAATTSMAPAPEVDDFATLCEVETAVVAKMQGDERGGFDLCEQLSHGWAWAQSFGSTAAAARGAHEYFSEPFGSQGLGLAVRGFARWPAFVTAEARRLGAAGAPQSAGLLPEIGCAWAALGAALVVWDYRRGDDFAVYEGLRDAVSAVCLAPPKPRVFVDAVKDVLVVATPSDVSLLALRRRVFFAASDGSVHEFEFAARESVLGRVARMVLPGGNPPAPPPPPPNPDAPKKRPPPAGYEGFSAAKCARRDPSAVRRLATALLPPFARPEWLLHPMRFLGVDGAGKDGLVDVVVDDARGALYALSASGVLGVYDLGRRGRDLRHVGSARVADAAKLWSAAHSARDTTAPSPQLFEPAARGDAKIVAVHVVSPLESATVHCVCVDDAGFRFYFSTTAPKSGLGAPAGRRREDQVSAPPSTGRELYGAKVGASFYGNGVFVVAKASGRDADRVLECAHVVGERRLVCLTRLGVEELAKVRPVDALRELLRSDLGDGARRFGSPADDKRSGGGDAALRAFAESYGRAEACAMALAIACGADAGGGGQVASQRAAALAAALDLGGRPRFVETATTSASTATQTAPPLLWFEDGRDRATFLLDAAELQALSTPVQELRNALRDEPALAVATRRDALALLGVLGRAGQDRAAGRRRDAPPPGAPAGSLLGLLGGPAMAAPKRPATAVDARLKQRPAAAGGAGAGARESGAPRGAAPASGVAEALVRELGGHCYLYFNGGDALAHGASLHLAKAARLTEGLRHAEAEAARGRLPPAPRRAWRSPSDVLPAAAPGASPPALATACDALRVHGCAAAAVKVALACAKNSAPASVPGDAGDAELAGDHWELALYRGRPPDGAQRRDEDAREACHDVALDALKRELWRCGAAATRPPTRRGDGADGALLACCGAKRGPFLDRCLEAAKAADDRRLVKLPLDAVEVYLRAADPGLLWRHHLAHGEDARAAALMEDLATAPGGDLDARVSCLVRGRVRAALRAGAAAPGASAPPRYDAAKIRELDELLARRATRPKRQRQRGADGEPGGEAAQLHDAGLENERALDLERVAATLEERLVGVSELYNDVASRYGMWDLCLVTLKVCGHDDEPLAVKLWTSLLRRLVGAARDASDLEKLHALANAADVLDAWATAAANDVRERRAFASGLRHGADPEHLIATLRGFEHTADPLLDKTLNLLHNTRDRVDAIFSR
ncbi:hypothetical protein JL721_1975 [Aureococcus anophagefferens]|nr:hypothetical protein JL721_1975 [Aureococcus anophagefferens]